MTGKKRLWAAVLAAVLLLVPSVPGCGKDARGKEVQPVKIGVAAYRRDDTFIASLCTYLEQIAKNRELKSGKKIVVNIMDGQSSQALQNDQVDSFIAQKYDVICVNVVDRTAAAVIVDKVRAADIPLIFFNREPVEEDLRLWDREYYVGADAAQSGRMQGELVAQEWKRNRAKWDKNGDGKIQYVMLEGEQGHQDAILRTEYSIKAVTGAGIPVEKLANDTANWQRAQGSAKMTQWLEAFGGRIEAVFANNDDMALGAIDAIRQRGKGITPLVVGIDATQNGLGAVQDGSMYGTILNDAKAQAQAIFSLSYDAFALGAAPAGVVSMTDVRSVRIPYRSVTRENLEEAYRLLRMDG